MHCASVKNAESVFSSDGSGTSLTAISPPSCGSLARYTIEFMPWPAPICLFFVYSSVATCFMQTPPAGEVGQRRQESPRGPCLPRSRGRRRGILRSRGIASLASCRVRLRLSEAGRKAQGSVASGPPPSRRPRDGFDASPRLCLHLATSTRPHVWRRPTANRYQSAGESVRDTSRAPMVRCRSRELQPDRWRGQAAAPAFRPRRPTSRLWVLLEARGYGLVSLLNHPCPFRPRPFVVPARTCLKEWLECTS